MHPLYTSNSTIFWISLPALRLPWLRISFAKNSTGAGCSRRLCAFILLGRLKNQRQTADGRSTAGFRHVYPVKNFEEMNCKYVTLSSYDALLPVAMENHYIEEAALEKLKAWKQDPQDESWMEK